MNQNKLVTFKDTFYFYLCFCVFAYVHMYVGALRPEEGISLELQ